jgi:type IV pilus assembly protein PilN
MKIPVNLASQPFRRDRAMLVASIAVCVLLAGVLAGLLSIARSDRVRMADVRGDIARLNRSVAAIRSQQADINRTLRRPENAEVFETSVFINALLLRKGISWTRIFADLEKTIPYNVKVIQIHPLLDSQNHIMLDMTVAFDQQGAMFELLKALAGSPLFGDAVPLQTEPPKQSEPMYRFHLRTPYAQKL